MSQDPIVAKEILGGPATPTGAAAKEIQGDLAIIGNLTVTGTFPGGGGFDGGTVHHTTRFYPDGVDEPPFIIQHTQEPPSVAAGQLTFWYDDGAGHPLLRAKGKDSLGHEVYFELPLADIGSRLAVTVIPFPNPDGALTTFLADADVHENTLAIYLNGLRVNPPELPIYVGGVSSLVGGIDAAAVSLDIDAWPIPTNLFGAPFYIVIDNETLLVTATSGPEGHTFAVSRAALNSSATSHADGATVSYETSFTFAAPPAADAVLLVDYWRRTDVAF